MWLSVAMVRDAFMGFLNSGLREGNNSAFCRADAVWVCDRVVTGIFFIQGSNKKFQCGKRT